MANALVFFDECDTLFESRERSKCAFQFVDAASKGSEDEHIDRKTDHETGRKQNENHRNTGKTISLGTLVWPRYVLSPRRPGRIPNNNCMEMVWAYIF